MENEKKKSRRDRKRLRAVKREVFWDEVYEINFDQEHQKNVLTTDGQQSTHS